MIDAEVYMKLLIVEDSIASAAFLQAVAKKAGYEIFGPLRDADSAYTFLMEEPGRVDMVLTDIFLSGDKTGVELMGQIPETVRPAVIFITASEDPDLSRRAGEVKPYGFLIKPFNELVLNNTLEIVSQRIRAERDLKRRIAFEQLIAQIYRRLHEESNPDFSRILQTLGEFVYADQISLFRKKKIASEDGLFLEVASFPPSSGQSSGMYSAEELYNRFRAGGSNFLEMAVYMPDKRELEGFIIFSRNNTESAWSGEDEQLLRLVAEMTGGYWYRRLTQDELNKAQASIISREKLASVGLLSGGIIHEIANPLSWVQANVRMMEKMVLDICAGASGWESEEMQEFRELLQETGEGVNRIGEIVSSIRDFSAGGGVEGVSRRSWYDLNEGIRSTLVVVRTFIQERAEVELDLGQVPSVSCLAGRINQVILNLLVNAVEAIKRAGIDDGIVRVSSEADDHAISCTICDNGPGMEDYDLDRLIYADGGGFGFSMARSVIEEEHGGTLKAFSGPSGRGCCVSFSLPL